MTSTTEFTTSANADRIRSKRLLTIEEAAILLGLSRSALYRAVNSGSIPFPVHKIGGFRYIPRAAIERILAGE